MVNNWKTELLVPDFSNFAARQSVRQGVENGILTKQIGFDKHGTFHPVRHFHSGSAYERYRRGMPPGYMGHIPVDAVPVTGGKIGVIEKKHPMIVPLMTSGIGMQLFRTEADILVDVLEALRSKGIVALPVHDAVIVADEDKDTTRTIMKAVFKDHTGITPQVTLG